MTMEKVERNAPCPCGSGKKYKQCCLKRDEALAASKRAETASLPKTIEVALEHHQAGRLPQAEALYRQILQLEPRHPDALHFLGVIAQQTGRSELAAGLIAESLLVKPGVIEAHSNLGLALQAQGKLDEAAEHYRKALSLNPNYAEAHNNLGNALKEQGKLSEAVASLRRAISLKPDFAEAHNNLGNALQAQGQLDDAFQCFHRALSLRPDYAEAHFNMGNVLQAQGKPDEAVSCFEKALTLRPNYAKAHYNIGFALHDQGKLDEAVERFQKALSLQPDYAEAHFNLANVLHAQGKLDDAVASYHQALTIKPDYAEAHCNLGNTLKDQGKLDEAINHYRKAFACKPELTDAYSNLLFSLNFHPDINGEAIFRASQEYETLISAPLRSTWRAHTNDKNPDRRLRVGYVSPDFRHHAVAYFAEPILSNHDKSQVEIFCYAEITKEDDYTGRFRQWADHWHSTVGLSDDAMAQMIRDHRIDILVDLAGHSAHNRLLVFARKPAPLQLTYLGYLGTTGLSAMDYLIGDRYIHPEGIADAYYAERLLRLPHSLWCYRPSADMPDVSPLPALARGYLTFGSFNNFNKVDLPTLDLWAELLRALPSSHLMMLTVPEGEARQRLLHRFADLGINAERLELHGKLPVAEFRRKFLEADLALDPVTVNGGTTTCETLWMGVPVISLVGTRFPSRAGLSLLSTVGLTDFAAASRADYIRLAAHLADNLPLLAEIRAGLRAHVAASPLVDEADFTRNLESLYRDIWGKWCRSS